MRVIILTAMLVGATSLAPSSFAQKNYDPPLHFTTLAEPAKVGTVAVALDANDTLYVADEANGVIRKFAPDGSFATLPAFFGGANGERTPAKFESLSAVASDARGNVYVAAGRSVAKISPDGATTMLADNINSPRGLAVDTSGSIYVADTNTHAIRKISPNGTATLFAGKPGDGGTVDGVESARFFYPTAIAVDSNGNVLVTQIGNLAVRKISPEGTVSTLARELGCGGIAVDSSGAIYVTVSEGRTGVPYRIFRVAPDGTITALSGSGGSTGLVEVGYLTSIAVDRFGVFYAVDGWHGLLLKSESPPGFRTPLFSQSVAQGGTAVFSVEASGTAPISFQWMKGGDTIPGATNATLAIGNVQSSDLGSYKVRATNVAGTSVGNPAVLSFLSTNTDALLNVSVHANVGAGSQSLSMGFIIDGGGIAGGKPLLIRAVGPSLGFFGVPGFLADPTLALFSGNTVIAASDDWSGDPLISVIGARVGAFAFASDTSRDAALYHAGLGAGVYTVQLSGSAGTRGVALAEIYDATVENAFASPRLTHFSARAQVGTGADTLIASFNLAGTSAKTLLIRAVGPTLGAFGVTGAVSDPKIALYDRAGRIVAENDNWSAGSDTDTARFNETMAKAGAFPLAEGSKDAALLETMPPGAYSVHVSGVSGASGVSLLEVYHVP